MYKLLLIMSLLFEAACVDLQMAPTYSLPGRAYFIRHLVTTSVWVCDATTGNLLCYEAAAAPYQATSNMAYQPR